MVELAKCFVSQKFRSFVACNGLLFFEAGLLLSYLLARQPQVWQHAHRCERGGSIDECAAATAARSESLSQVDGTQYQARSIPVKRRLHTSRDQKKPKSETNNTLLKMRAPAKMYVRLRFKDEIQDYITPKFMSNDGYHAILTSFICDWITLKMPC
eukprot:4702417-Amphidinium_carterae.1